MKPKINPALAAVTVLTVGIIALAVYYLSQPEPVYSRGQLLTSETITRGNTDSTNFLVEFSDFQCPACGAFKPLVDQIITKYGDRLVFGYRHFPLPQHKVSREAALAFEAAARQGKGWEMYDYLFTNQDKLSLEFINGAPEALGLDKQKFLDAFASKEVTDKVSRDLSDAGTLRIDSTPTFFLNGRKLRLNQPGDLEIEIKKELGQ